MKKLLVGWAFVFLAINGSSPKKNLITSVNLDKKAQAYISKQLQCNTKAPYCTYYISPLITIGTETIALPNKAITFQGTIQPFNLQQELNKAILLYNKEFSQQVPMTIPVESISFALTFEHNFCAKNGKNNKTMITALGKQGCPQGYTLHSSSITTNAVPYVKNRHTYTLSTQPNWAGQEEPYLY